jgi:hypothetical protein
MSSFRSSLESLTGQLSVGSLCLLGLFLLFDGLTPVYEVVEGYGSSTAWSILAAFPTLVIAYVLGLLAVSAAEILLSPIAALHAPADQADFVDIALLDNEAIFQRYAELVRHQRLLEGGSLGFVVLAVGALSEVFHVPVYSRLAWVLFTGSLLLSLVCPFFSLRIVGERRTLAAEARKRRGMLEKLLANTAVEPFTPPDARKRAPVSS